MQKQKTHFLSEFCTIEKKMNKYDLDFKISSIYIIIIYGWKYLEVYLV